MSSRSKHFSKARMFKGIFMMDGVLATRGVEAMRQPDRNPRCYEMTENERNTKIREWNKSNIWNEPILSEQDTDTYYGA